MTDAHHERDDRIIVALDGMPEPAALALARELAPHVWGFKINDLLLRGGMEVVPRLKRYGRVFCDPKLHDIPNTVAHAVTALCDAGADLITLHTSGGVDMLRAAAQARRGGAELLGATVLTAHADAVAQRVYGASTLEVVARLARIALDGGIDGIVCAPGDLATVDGVDPRRRLRRVIPGIRPAWHGTPDDQQRTGTPAQAIRDGAHLLVIGRPITEAADPPEACRKICRELAGLASAPER